VAEWRWECFSHCRFAFESITTDVQDSKGWRFVKPDERWLHWKLIKLCPSYFTFPALWGPNTYRKIYEIFIKNHCPPLEPSQILPLATGKRRQRNHFGNSQTKLNTQSRKFHFDKILIWPKAQSRERSLVENPRTLDPEAATSPRASIIQRC